MPPPADYDLLCFSTPQVGLSAFAMAVTSCGYGGDLPNFLATVSRRVNIGAPAAPLMHALAKAHDAKFPGRSCSPDAVKAMGLPDIE